MGIGLMTATGRIVKIMNGSLPCWVAGMLAYVRADAPDLTHRQLAMLSIVQFTSGPHTVRGLARQLRVSKPVITRALDKLTQLGYLRRQPDQNDGRNVFVVATTQGAEFLETFDRFFDADDGRGADRRVAGGAA
ncbi:MarR family transcriptional regulator [Blastomonas sp.]|uniref:MarR family transcriptional regulator n=1 Tax=Blastomonas sp. TaxID=1909299 RepID=UPI003594313A